MSLAVSRCIFILIFIPVSLFAKYNVSMCTIFQNDAPFLREWIEFHKMQGIEHFYMYNNDSSDDYLAMLQPYMDKGVITLVQWPYDYNEGDVVAWKDIQTGAYMDCIAKYGKDSRWIAFIDSDEFLFCPSGKKLHAFLRRYKNHAAVCANWLMFGTSDVEVIPEDCLMIELLTHCSHPSNSVNSHVKSIVQPKFVVGCPNPHYFYYKEGFYAVGSDLAPIPGAFSQIINHDKIRINHYWTRTNRYFHEFKIPSRHKRRREKEDSLEKAAEAFNQATDDRILRFVPALRKRMKLRSRS